MNTYELKFKDGGLWIDTQQFMKLAEELQIRFGVNAEISSSANGVEFTLVKTE